MGEATITYPPVLASFLDAFDAASADDQRSLRNQLDLYLSLEADDRAELLKKHSLLASLIGAIGGVRVYEPAYRNALQPFSQYLLDRAGISLSRGRIFELIYTQQLWGGGESPSGSGSFLEATFSLREALPKLFIRYHIRSMLDAPCGDFNWMKELGVGALLESYHGVDIVPAMIALNQRRYAEPNLHFSVLDLVTTTPPKTDLILCRHLLMHLTLNDCLAVLNHFRESGAHYLLITSSPDAARNDEIVITGAYRPLNVEIPPFNLGPRLEVVDDRQNPGDQTILALYSMQ